jgi:ankyrin repeat protein
MGVEMYPPDNGITELMRAASRGDSHAFLRELSETADVNARDVFGHTALAYAAMAGHERIVRALLMMGAEIETENHIGLTPAKLAALRGHHHVARLLCGPHETDEPEAPTQTMNDGDGGGWLTRSELEHGFEEWELSLRDSHDAPR